MALFMHYARNLPSHPQDKKTNSQRSMNTNLLDHNNQFKFQTLMKMFLHCESTIMVSSNQCNILLFYQAHSLVYEV